MNPDTNKFEVLKEIVSEKDPNHQQALNEVFERYFQSNQGQAKLLRADGPEVPKHWAVFQIGELVVIKDYTFKVAYINDGAILFEPVGQKVIEELTDDEFLKHLK